MTITGNTSCSTHEEGSVPIDRESTGSPIESAGNRVYSGGIRLGNACTSTSRITGGRDLEDFPHRFESSQRIGTKKLRTLRVTLQYILGPIKSFVYSLATNRCRR